MYKAYCRENNPPPTRKRRREHIWVEGSNAEGAGRIAAAVFFQEHGDVGEVYIELERRTGQVEVGWDLQSVAAEFGPRAFRIEKFKRGVWRRMQALPVDREELFRIGGVAL